MAFTTTTPQRTAHEDHERRMSERDWAVGDQVMVEVEVMQWDDFETEFHEATVVACDSEGMDTFEVVFEDGERDRVAGCEVMSMVEFAQRQ